MRAAVVAPTTIEPGSPRMTSGASSSSIARIASGIGRAVPDSGGHHTRSRVQGHHDGGHRLVGTEAVNELLDSQGGVGRTGRRIFDGLQPEGDVESSLIVRHDHPAKCLHLLGEAIDTPVTRQARGWASFQTARRRRNVTWPRNASPPAGSWGGRNRLGALWPPGWRPDASGLRSPAEAEDRACPCDTGGSSEVAPSASAAREMFQPAPIEALEEPAPLVPFHRASDALAGPFGDLVAGRALEVARGVGVAVSSDTGARHLAARGLHRE